MLFLLSCSLIGIFTEYQILKTIFTEKNLENHFKLKLIIFSQKKNTYQLSQTSRKRIGFLLIISLSKNILLLYYSLSYLFPSIIKISNEIKELTDLLCFAALIEIFSLNKNFSLIIETFERGIISFTQSFFGYISIAIAFILTGTLLLNHSEFFSSFPISFRTLFSLMTGDNILTFFDNLKSIGWFGSFFLMFSLMFFVFILQSFYTMIITDSFISIIENEEKEDQENVFESQISKHNGDELKKLYTFVSKNGLTNFQKEEKVDKKKKHKILKNDKNKKQKNEKKNTEANFHEKNTQNEISNKIETKKLKEIVEENFHERKYSNATNKNEIMIDKNQNNKRNKNLSLTEKKIQMENECEIEHHNLTINDLNDENGAKSLKKFPKEFQKSSKRVPK